jgi:hypothetical protein
VFGGISGKTIISSTLYIVSLFFARVFFRVKCVSLLYILSAVVVVVVVVVRALLIVSKVLFKRVEKNSNFGGLKKN